MLGTSAIFVLGMRQKLRPATQQEIFNVKHIRDAPFMSYCFALFFGFMGVYVIFFYIQIYAIEVSDTNISLAFYLLPIINATSTFGRLLSNFLADKFGPLNVQIPFALVAALLCFCWIAIKTMASLIVLCALYGFFCGSFVSLTGPTVVSLSPNPGTIGTRIGISIASAGIGLLIGSPIAGAILQTPSGWAGLQVWCGALLAISGFFSLTARFLKTGPRLALKA